MQVSIFSLEGGSLSVHKEQKSSSWPPTVSICMENPAPAKDDTEYIRVLASNSLHTYGKPCSCQRCLQSTSELAKGSDPQSQSHLKSKIVGPNKMVQWVKYHLPEDLSSTSGTHSVAGRHTSALPHQQVNSLKDYLLNKEEKRTN